MMPEDKGDKSQNIAEEADNFLRRRMVGRDHNSEISSQEAKIRAMKINELEKDVLAIATAFDVTNYYEDPSTSTGPVSITIHDYSTPENLNLSVTGFTDELGGMGDIMPIGGGRAINFYAMEDFPSELLEDFGVKTSHYFSVSLFTDTETFDVVKDLWEKGEISNEFMYTSYFFDDEGNSAKSIQLPKSVPDERTPLRSGDFYKTIVGKLSKGDFELAERAITLLKDGVTRNYKKKLGQ